jgi:MarR family transcriptional regulator, organic hydroperoxide resistance regulator
MVESYQGSGRDDDLLALLRTVHLALDAVLGALAAGGRDLSAGEFCLLLAWGGDDVASPGTLGTRTGQPASTVSGVLGRLERKGLVTRAIDPGDRRTFALRLTADGAAAAADARRAAAGWSARAAG